MRNKLLVVLGAVFTVICTTLMFSPAAFAGTGNTYCLTPTHTKCINAWSGGPFVKLYVGAGNGGSNSDFTAFGGIQGHIILKYTGNSSWADGKHCIGDAYNDPDHADSSLDVCNTATGEYGWGTFFDPGFSGCLPGYSWFRNVHWGGYLGPADANTNGSPMYLNKPTPYCFLDGDPA